MADIKNLSIFGSKNRGLERIKSQTKQQKDSSNIIDNEAPSVNTKIPQVEKKTQPYENGILPKRVGAPIQNYDRVFSAMQSIKISAILNAISRVLVEKYMVEDTRDEVLRKALNSYIMHNLTKEDKRDLLSDVSKDLNIFRNKFPTVERTDISGVLIQSVDDIQKQTLESLKTSWGL